MKTKILLFISFCIIGSLAAQTPATGDYRTTATTTMPTTTGWERFDGSAWVAATNQPSGSVRQAGTASSGSSIVTLTAPNDLIRVGQIVTGTGTAIGTSVLSISGTALELTKNTSGAVTTASALIFSESAINIAFSTTSLSKTVTLSVANSAIVPGMLVSGTGIPTGATIASVETTTSFTLSVAATATGNATNMTYYTPQTTALAFASGATSITLNAANSLLSTGMSVYGTGIVQGTTITSVTGTTIYLSIPTSQAQTTATPILFGYVVIPNMYINNNVTAQGNNRSSTIGNLIIANSTNFAIGDGSNQSDFLFGTISIGTGATLSNTSSATARANSLILNGGANGSCITNNGTLDLTATSGNLSLTRTTIVTQGNTSITGTGTTTKFNELTLQLGSVNNTLDISLPFSILTASAASTLKLTSGIFKISSACDLTPFGATAQTIPVSTGLYLNHASANVSCGFTDGTGLTVNGFVTLANGKLTVNGKYGANTTGTTTISGGTLEIPTGLTYSSNGNALFQVTSTHTFNMTGGNVNIKSHNTGTYANPDLYVTSANYSITGGTFNFSDAATLKFNCPRFFNLNIATGVTVGANVSVDGDLTLASGSTLADGGKIITVAGNIAGAGTHTGLGRISMTGTNKTISGISTQTLELINSGTFNVTGNAGVANLTIGSGSILNVNAGKQLTVSTTLSNSGALNLLSTSANGTATILTPTTLSGTGSYSAQQYLGTTRNWYVSSPITNAKAPNSGYTYFMKRDETGQNPSPVAPATAYWVNVEGNSNFSPGTGYIALPSATETTLQFTSVSTTGKFNNGTVPITLTWAGAASKGFNLIGNPYPSHLTWTKAFVDDVTNAALIEPSIYYRTNTGDVNSGGNAAWSFKTYNSSTDEFSPAGTTNIIPPMQAFWIRAKAAGTLNLDSKLTRSHQSSNPMKAPAMKNNDRQRVRLEVSNGTRTDETLLLFDENAADGYDAFDSPKFAEASSEVQIFTTVEDEKLVMNGMKNLPLNQEISLGFIPGNANSFIIKANEITNLPTDVKVILIDKATRIETDLTDGNTVYSFIPVTTVGDRFSVIFRTSSSVNAIDNLDDKVNMNVFVDANKQINVSGCIGTNCKIVVCNAIGQKLIDMNSTGTTTTINKVLKAGVYFVTLNVAERISTKKLIIN